MTRVRLGIALTCQKCRKRVTSTRPRSIVSKSYMGPCGDSFCYASCDSPTCKPMSVTVCDDCAKAIGKPA